MWKVCSLFWKIHILFGSFFDDSSTTYVLTSLNRLLADSYISWTENSLACGPLSKHAEHMTKKTLTQSKPPTIP